MFGYGLDTGTKSTPFINLRAWGFLIAADPEGRDV